MRRRTLIWLVSSLLLFVLLLPVLLRLSREKAFRSSRVPAGNAAQTGADFSTKPAPASSPARGPLAYRLTNTTKSAGELTRSERAILLENAALDTTQPLTLPFPANLRAQGAPGAYIVQARVAPDAAFRTFLESNGAAIVAYIPNNAFLVRATADIGRALASDSRTWCVIPYEPYFKLKPSVLEIALGNPGPAEERNLPDKSQPLALNLLLFPDSGSSIRPGLGDLGVEVLGEEASPFGPVLRVRMSPGHLAALAALPGVQEVELSRARVSANDLSRAILGIAADTRSPSNYLGLTGSNILVNLNDTGVDSLQDDLLGRVSLDVPGSGVDANGHGTHVAGIIAGSGRQSTNLASAPGSLLPAADLQFRGKAPGARLFAIATALTPEASVADTYLQQQAAQTNAFISNNSWHYANDNDYDLAAASYDAAVRDALPARPGPQPVLFVFAAGNAGGGDNDGSGGNPGTIQSPATAKNVLTVGAFELPRLITNQTWSCAGSCVTNTPWLPLTDSSNQVAAFSSRGNVGIGIEGEAGRFKPDLVAPGTFVVSTRSTQWDQGAFYADTNNLFLGSFDTNACNVLSNLNASLGPHYRFESGTSLAAAEVSGTLALMQEFFEQRLGLTNSPALMKSLLINGARSLTNHYDFHCATNAQGWGVPCLPHSIPAALTNLDSPTNSMFLFDQNPANALRTGDQQTRFLAVSPAARSQPLRLTLVWTDPPGNPVAGLKLVNDLDLLVTNLDTGDVFFGNDIPAGNQFNVAWDTLSPANLDVVNNVENVYLAPPLSAQYSVSVSGHRVNVNAVTANSDGIVQDYALVISSGDGQLPDALTLTNGPPTSQTQPSVTLLTNNFNATPGVAGALMLNQRVGANAPLMGTNVVPLAGATNIGIAIGPTNQWRFYVLTNDTAFTNAAFLTFLPAALAVPLPALVQPTNLGNVLRHEPDIDLYVSTDPGLTNLDPAAIAAADKSLGRGGTETILYSNAIPGLYYIGIKSESQQAAQYGLLALLSEQPFADTDFQGNQFLHGFPAPAFIPGGTSARPGAGYVFAVASDPLAIRRVVVTNTLTHPAMSDLLGTLTHDATSVVLDNHSTNGAVSTQDFIYDDSGEGDFPGAQVPDGPGRLWEFGGRQGLGQWMLTMLSTNQPGINESLQLFLEAQSDLTGGVTPAIAAGACREDFIYLPPGITNVTAVASLFAGDGPVSFSLGPRGLSFSNCPTLQLSAAFPSAALTLDPGSYPPINPGLYAVRLCNLGSVPANLNLIASFILDPNPAPPVSYTSAAATAILDDAITSSTIAVTNRDRVISVSVAVRIAHPRISDLALYLLSPGGTRVLLDENRGGASPDGMGFDMTVTNFPRLTASGGAAAATNTIDTGQTSGTLDINGDFYAEPDVLHVYYEGHLIFDSGSISNTFTNNVSYGPGLSTFVTFVMNEGDNPNPDTSWFYAVTSTRLAPLCLTFTEDTNLTTTPIKFAVPPFTNLTFSGANPVPPDGIYLLPEEPLDKCAGQCAFGPWTLELWDSRAGPPGPAPELLNWQLAFTFARANPNVTISQISPSTSGVLLGWNALANSRFQVQWTPSLAPAVWVPFSNVVSSPSGACSFLDDGSQSGGLGQARFYRLVQVP